MQFDEKVDNALKVIRLYIFKRKMFKPWKNL